MASGLVCTERLPPVLTAILVCTPAHSGSAGPAMGIHETVLVSRSVTFQAHRVAGAGLPRGPRQCGHLCRPVAHGSGRTRSAPRAGEGDTGPLHPLSSPRPRPQRGSSAWETPACWSLCGCGGAAWRRAWLCWSHVDSQDPRRSSSTTHRPPRRGSAPSPCRGCRQPLAPALVASSPRKSAGAPGPR